MTSLDPWLGFVGALLLLAATAEVLLPTRFVLGEDGVEIDNPLRRARRSWDRFGSWAATDDGFRLVGASRHALLRRRASVTLRCGDEAERVTAVLRDRLGESRA